MSAAPFSFQQKEDPMAYTPELTYENSCTLRRIAWAEGMPMTKALDSIIQTIAGQLDHSKVCALCKDKTKCSDCRFNR